MPRGPRSPANLLALQRSAGNRAVATLVGRNSTGAPSLQRAPTSAKPERPELPEPHGAWMTEPWLCEMRQEPWGSNARLLAPGARGQSVVLLHRVLQNWVGWKWETGTPAAHTLPDWKSDVFTSETRAVVRDFQKHLGTVMREGYVGPETIGHLDGFVGGPDPARTPKPGECRTPRKEDPEPTPEEPGGCSDCDPWETDPDRPMYPWEGPARPWPRKGCDLLCKRKTPAKVDRRPIVTDEWTVQILGSLSYFNIGGFADADIEVRMTKPDRYGRLFAMKFHYAGVGLGGGWGTKGAKAVLGKTPSCAAESAAEPFTTTKPIEIRRWAGPARYSTVGASVGWGGSMDVITFYGPEKAGADAAILEWAGTGASCPSVGGGVTKGHVGPRSTPRRI